VKRPLVVALNPSIDAEWRVAAVRWEEKNDVQSERRWAGGKGVNVARWLTFHGCGPQLLLPLGGATGDELATLLSREGIDTRIFELGRNQSTRVNVIVTTDAQGQMRFNPSGPKFNPSQWRAFKSYIVKALPGTDFLVLSGSLPRGLAHGAYVELIRLARRQGVSVLLDCDGPALAAALSAKPFLVKPNEHELLAWFQASDVSKVLKCPTLKGVPRKVVRAAAAMSSRSGGWVCVSRGAKQALLVNVAAEQFMTALPPKTRVRNTVGAGDAMLAGMLKEVRRDAAPLQWLKTGLRMGSTGTRLAAGQLPSK
jgi:1-phosphofructokinase family hexose kinase